MPHPWNLTTQPSFKETSVRGIDFQSVVFTIFNGGGGEAYLQWTEIGPSCPNCSLVLCTWPMKSMNPSPDLGTPCSGQSVNWNCRTVLDWPSCRNTEDEDHA